MDVLKFCDGLLDDLETIVKEESVALAGGAAKDHADYKHRVGVISGLKRAQDRALERRRKLLDEDDDDDV